jgi:hypothetical protein
MSHMPAFYSDMYAAITGHHSDISCIFQINQTADWLMCLLNETSYEQICPLIYMFYNCFPHSDMIWYVQRIKLYKGNLTVRTIYICVCQTEK